MMSVWIVLIELAGDIHQGRDSHTRVDSVWDTELAADARAESVGGWVEQFEINKVAL